MTFISYAQNYEDVMLWRALKDVTNGFYIDVGANDPIVFSATQAFYERGWHGINIEPARSCYELLCNVRTLDINLPFVVSDVDGELTFYEILGTGLLTIDADIVKRERAAGWKVIEKKVEAFTLNQIFEKYVSGPVHFLKIDVEGAEKIVLQGLNLTHWRPWILVVEATIPLSEELNYDAWEPSVLAAGYDMVYFDGLNRFYVAREHAELGESFKVPPNVFDDFMLFGYKKALEEQGRIQRQLTDVTAERDRIQPVLNKVTADLSDLRSTFSWRVTRPIRQLKEGIKYIRHIYETRIKLGLMKPAVSRLVSMVYKRSQLKHILFLIIHKFPKIENRMRKVVESSGANNETPDILKSKLSEHAQIIYYDLLSAIQKENSGK